MTDSKLENETSFGLDKLTLNGKFSLFELLSATFLTTFL